METKQELEEIASKNHIHECLECGSISLASEAVFEKVRLGENDFTCIKSRTHVKGFKYSNIPKYVAQQLADKNLTPEEHRERHQMLHKRLDELIADWIGQTKCLPSKNTVLELMTWSNEQCKKPTDLNL